MVLNPRQDEKEFYKTILHPTDVILARSVESVNPMEVDKDDLEEAEAAASFTEKARVFDKVSAAESTHLQKQHPHKPRNHLSQKPHLIS